MKKYLIGAGVVVVLLILVLGWSQAISYVSGGRALAEKGFKENVPLGLETARIEEMMRGVDKSIYRQHERVICAQVDAEDIEKEIWERHLRLTEDKKLLEEVAEMLSSGKNSYDIGGMKYSRTEVEMDAHKKLLQYQQDEKMLSIKKQTVGALHNATSTAIEEIRKAEAKKEEQAGSLEMVKAKKQRYEARKELNVSTGHGLRGRSKSAVGRVAQAVKDLEIRLEKEERILQGRIEALERPATGIDYRQKKSASVAEEIKDYFAVEG